MKLAPQNYIYRPSDPPTPPSRTSNTTRGESLNEDTSLFWGHLFVIDWSYTQSVINGI